MSLGSCNRKRNQLDERYSVFFLHRFLGGGIAVRLWCAQLARRLGAGEEKLPKTVIERLPPAVCSHMRQWSRR